MNNSNLEFPKVNYQNKDIEAVIRGNSISNAYIFFGPDGVGKKDTALKFIEELIKKRISDVTFRNRISKGNNPDLILVEPTYLIKGILKKKSDLKEDIYQRNKPIIRVNQIRDIRKILGIKSIQSGKKFVLIEDAHLLNEAASNCLLKTLEEPENGIFILLTSNINGLLETIKSRCQQIRFKRITKQELINQVNKNNQISSKLEKDLQDLIYLANGSPKKLDKIIKIWLEIPESIKNKIKSPIYENIEILTLAKIITDEMNGEQQEFLVDFIQYKWWKETFNMQIPKAIENLKINLKNNIQPRLAWEVCLLKIALKDYQENPKY